ncbi:MAG: FAD-binding oxidoreductase [Alphaproteobacteria bacterium]|nr:FAD-binding oxidoreductase [Alphaproteobacteria bacterium]OJV15271.1 MAG: hypothetical protein BGO27_02045 [Alphaproteobacteria bacterium 33-17]
MKYDVAIVGNGIIGLSIAYNLTKKHNNIRIAVVAPKSRLSGATNAAGGMISCFGELTHSSLKTELGNKKFDTCYKALRKWDDHINELNRGFSDKLEINKGTYVINNSKSGIVDHENIYAMIAALNDFNEDYSRIDPFTIPGFKPVEDARAIEAYYLPNEGFINPTLILDRLLDILSANDNVDIIDDAVIKSDKNASGFSIELKSNASITADQLLLCAGSYTQSIIENSDFGINTVPIFAGLGQAVLIEKVINVPHLIRTPNRSGACGLHILPYNDNSLYVGASNNVYVNPSDLSEVGIIHFLLECTVEQLHQDFYKAKMQKIMVGNRPASLDGLPLIGETSVKGLWVISGTYRDGFHQSPIISEEVANRILGIDTSTDLSIFSPERKPIEHYTVEESIKEATKHYMSGAYERAMKLPKAGWDDFISGMIEDKIRELYNKIGVNFALNPDIVLMFQFSNNQDALISYFQEYFKNFENNDNLEKMDLSA